MVQKSTSVLEKGSPDVYDESVMYKLTGMVFMHQRLRHFQFSCPAGANLVNLAGLDPPGRPHGKSTMAKVVVSRPISLPGQLSSTSVLGITHSSVFCC